MTNSRPRSSRRGAGLVAVLGLDLVDRERQVLVGAVEVLHQEREHLLVGGAEQVVGVLRSLSRKMPSPYSVQRPVASWGSGAGAAGNSTSCAPMPSISRG